MKIILFSLLAAAAFFQYGCSVTQEMQENASFEGLVKFYVENPVGTGELFFQTGNVENVDAVLKSAISEYLKGKGFDEVSKKSEAQIIFRPLLNASYRQPEFENSRSINSTSQALPIGTTAASNLYATLEIQAILPNSGDIWSWRGFSPTMMSATNFTTASIKEQVAWCLEYFPPEKNPSRLEEIREKRKESKIKAEENPFKEVLVKEREKREKASQ